MARTAVVAGATGLVGLELLGQLAGRPDYTEVKVLGRRAPAQALPRQRFLQTDFSNFEALQPELAVDTVFCCLGTTKRQAGSEAAFERVDYHMVVGLARAAHKAGARQFLVVSAAGASARSPAFYPRVKARMEQAVADIGFEVVHIVRPSLLLGPRREFRPAEKLLQWLSPLYAPLLRGPLKRYRPVPAAAVAGALLTLADRRASGVHRHHLPLAA